MKAWLGVVAGAFAGVCVAVQSVEAAGQVEEGADPMLAVVDGKAPEIIREAAAMTPEPEGVKVKRVVFRLRPDAEVMAVVASPTAPGPHPGLLVLHGATLWSDEARASMWAKLGYVVVAPDIPGFANRSKFVESRGNWKQIIANNRYVAVPESGVIYDVVAPAMKALELLRAQENVDKGHIGVWGVSWGGYTSTMVCALAGEKVQAGFSLYGGGFYELNSQLKHLALMPDAEREAWLKYVDAGRRASGIKAPFFIAGATNDFFFWPLSVQATLDAIPEGLKNQVWAANVSHAITVPGGQGNSAESRFDKGPSTIERSYFDYYLRGIGKPMPKVEVVVSPSAEVARFKVNSPTPITQVEVYYSEEGGDWTKRTWVAAPVKKVEGEVYEAKLNPGAGGGYWFASASDDRPVTVSSRLVRVGGRSKAEGGARK